MTHNEIIIQYLRDYGSINWMKALDNYYIGGGFRARITEVRRALARIGVTLLHRSIANKNNDGSHYEYYLTENDRQKLRENYSRIEFKEEKIKEPKQLNIFA